MFGGLMPNHFVRDLDPEMGLGVAKRSYLRNGETWGELSERVALGNTLLHRTGENDREELEAAIASGTFLCAGRHLQHGDHLQPSKNIELFSNCATACLSSVEFLLLLNGAGVGRNYSDEFMVIDWQNMPIIYNVLSDKHPDYVNFAQPIKDRPGFTVLSDTNKSLPIADVYHVIEDSREGWARAAELLETATWKKEKDKIIIFDYSKIREYGKPIGGMQNRPASGPIPLMYAFENIKQIKSIDMMPWKQAMFVDHFLSECVANGGARRSARIAVKYWKDSQIKSFITIKRDNPWLWSSNNSVGADSEFWDNAAIDGTGAQDIFNLITQISYGNMSGEPGIVNVDKLVVKE